MFPLEEFGRFSLFDRADIGTRETVARPRSPFTCLRSPENTIVVAAIVPAIVPKGHIGSILGCIRKPIVIKVDPLFLIRYLVRILCLFLSPLSPVLPFFSDFLLLSLSLPDYASSTKYKQSFSYKLSIKSVLRLIPPPEQKEISLCDSY